MVISNSVVMFKSLKRFVEKLRLGLPLLLLGHGVQEGGKKVLTDKQINKNGITNKANGFVDKCTNFFFTRDKYDQDLFKFIKRPLRVGVFVILIFFGVFCLWGVVANIEGYVVASGQVVSLSSRKMIQHFEGGIVEEIFVKEGDIVNKGDLLIKLKDVSAKSQKIILEERLHSLKATEARLIAERDGDDEIVVDEGYKWGGDEVVDNQKRLFISRKSNLNSQIKILEMQIQQGNNEKVGVEAQLLSAQQQMQLVIEELDSKKILFDSGNIDRPSIINLEKQLAVLRSKIAECNAMFARIEQQRSSTELEILNLKNKFQNDVVNELKEVQGNASDVEEKLLAVGDIFHRTEIKAPQTGVVTNLQYRTIGGVVAPGSKIMEIIPSGDQLVIEAKVLPKDIDAVLYAKYNNVTTLDGITGSKARIRVLALNTRKVPLLSGVMTNISADTIADSQNPMMQYYLANITIPASELKSTSGSKVVLYPGMPVMTFIITEPRTLFSYLLSPISSTFDSAFRER